MVEAQPADIESYKDGGGWVGAIQVWSVNDQFWMICYCFCNSFYTVLPLKLTQKLQFVQIAAAWLLTGTPVTAHIQDMLCQLH